MVSITDLYISIYAPTLSISGGEIKKMYLLSQNHQEIVKKFSQL